MHTHNPTFIRLCSCLLFFALLNQGNADTPAATPNAVANASPSYRIINEVHRFALDDWATVEPQKKREIRGVALRFDPPQLASSTDGRRVFALQKRKKSQPFHFVRNWAATHFTLAEQKIFKSKIRWETGPTTFFVKHAHSDEISDDMRCLNDVKHFNLARQAFVAVTQRDTTLVSSLHVFTSRDGQHTEIVPIGPSWLVSEGSSAATTLKGYVVPGITENMPNAARTHLTLKYMVDFEGAVNISDTALVPVRIRSKTAIIPEAELGRWVHEDGAGKNSIFEAIIEDQCIYRTVIGIQEIAFYPSDALSPIGHPVEDTPVAFNETGAQIPDFDPDVVRYGSQQEGEAGVVRNAP